MTTEEALQIIAETIWESPRHNFEGCLVPSDIKKSWGEPVHDFNFASDVLVKEFSATHYNLTWKEKGKIATLLLMRCESLGACNKPGLFVLEKDIAVVG